MKWYQNEISPDSIVISSRVRLARNLENYPFPPKLDGKGREKIISAVRMVDFTTSSKRQVLPGMRYDLPPSQNKADPLCETEEGFESKLNEAPPEEEASRFICDSYEGISPLIAREIVYRARGCVDANVRECGNALKNAFFDMVGLIDREEFSPTLVVVDGKYAEYSFTGIKQYGPSSSNEICTSFGALLDLYYVKKDREHRIRQMTHELSKFLSNNDHTSLPSPQLLHPIAHHNPKTGRNSPE